jgi:hypothetical protein
MEPRDRANLALLMLYLAPAAEHVAVLQAMQQLVQWELARLWSVVASPGHTLNVTKEKWPSCANETS